MRIVTCRCERNFDADLPKEVELDREAGQVEAILDGSFMSTICPHCGERIKPELEVKLRSNRKRVALHVFPESDRRAWNAGQVAAGPDEEILIGYPELYERILMMSLGLDAGAVEILKYHILARAVEGLDESAEQPVVAFRGRLGDGRLSFGISGLRKDELALLSLPFDRYEAAIRDLPRLASTEPFADFLSGAYRSVRALEGE